MKKAVLLVAIVFLFILIFLSTPLLLKYILTGYKAETLSIEAIRYTILAYIFIRFLCIVGCGYLFVRWFRRIDLARFKLLKMACYNLFMILLLLEGIFTLVPYNNNAFSLSRLNWIGYYWTPTNELGYRDIELETEGVKDKKIIICLGDSYTAGLGINNAEDRYSNLLSKKLPDDYKVFNLGVPAANTQDEFENLKNFPVKPDIIVLQHCQNDLDDLLADKRLQYQSESSIQLALQKFIYFSYFINYVHSVISPPVSDSTYERYGEYLENIYGDETIMNKLYVVFDEIVSYCDGNNIKLVVVLYPLLGMNDKYYDYSYIYTNPIENYFNNKNIAVLNITPLLKKIPVSQRVVSASDYHPNELVNEIIAENLLPIVLEME